MSAHAFICECGDPRCRERIPLDEATWDAAARRGRVVGVKHGRGHRVIERHEAFLVVDNGGLL